MSDRLPPGTPLWLLFLYLVLLILSTVMAAVLISVYQWHTKGKWRTKQVGIHMMTHAIVIFLLLLFTVLGTFGKLSILVTLIIGCTLFTALIGLKVNQIRLIFRSRRRRELAGRNPAAEMERTQKESDALM